MTKISRYAIFLRMPNSKSKKPAHKKAPARKSLDETYETEELVEDDELEIEEPARTSYGYSNKPPYLLVILLMAISFFAGYLLFKVLSLQQKLDTVAANPSAAGDAQQQAPKEIKIKKPTSSDHWKGNKDARYVWVEYSDYECPFCKRNHPDLVKLTEAYKDNLAWVFRQYPLPFHPKAQKSAEGSECVAELGGNDAFWKYTDIVFEKMPELELAGLGGVAAEAGVNEGAFKECLDSNKYEKKVKDQSAEGSQAGVQATPTGVIYDMKTGKSLAIEGALPYDSLKQQLDTFIAQNK